VLRRLWQGDAVFGEIKAALTADRPMASTTIATVLSRLEASHFVKSREGERGRIYAAAIGQDELQRNQTRRLVDRLFGGRPSDLIAHLVRESDMDQAELDRLKKLIRGRRQS
jgi:predicted transcriptional regulator